jgi:acrylyl-CoA reductase (NADPH)/3-hydroxypropionyl-CoA dehydratase/3-hydroxypropionyl-CoA synthetase
LPVRSATYPSIDDESAIAAMVRRGELLPVGAAFFPGLTPLPVWQYGHAVIRDPATGAPAHGLPKDSDREILLPVPHPEPNEALVYVLASSPVSRCRRSRTTTSTTR